MIDGIINVYKEAGYTSHDVVAKLRGILKQKKIGHTGTLDPEAVGVLPVCLGKGTKLCALLTDQDKTYEAVMRLGVVTDTQDMTGRILDERPADCSVQQVQTVVESFLGDQMQIPPMYSALKVGGKKLYELAREGIEVERKPRPVRFDRIEILGMDLPLVRIRVTCSKGTYIRTLCHDIGAKLGCGAAMESLVRTGSGRFVLEESRTLEEIAELAGEGKIGEAVCSVESMLGEYPALHCPAELDRLLHNGNPLDIRALGPGTPSGRVRAYDSEGCFVGLYEERPDRGKYCPVRMF